MKSGFVGKKVKFTCAADRDFSGACLRRTRPGGSAVPRVLVDAMWSREPCVRVASIDSRLQQLLEFAWVDEDGEVWRQRAGGYD